MKRMILLSIWLIVVIGNGNLLQAQSPAEIIIQSVTVLPMYKEVMVPNQDVVIRNGLIVSVAPAGRYKPSKGATLISGKGRYLMPGLAEMHAHVPPTDNLEAMKEVLLLFLANGITHIRGMLGHPLHLTLREQIKTGTVLGPSLYTSGPSANGNSVNSAEVARQFVQQQKAAGYDFIKIHPGIKLDAYEALSKKAKELKIPFAGHVPSDVGVWNAMEMGLQTIDHMDGMVESLIPGKERFAEGAHGLFAVNIFMEADTKHIPKLVTALKSRNVWVVPTQALAVRWIAPGASAVERSTEAEMQYMDKKTIAKWVQTKNDMENANSYPRNNMPQYIALRNQLIKACQQNGVPLLLGSDAPQVFNVPGFSAHHELKYMVDAGLSPYEALYSGTVNVGKFYGKEKMGTIQEGAPADLVLLNGNPLQDISQTKQIEGIIVAGKWLDQAWIKNTLAAIAAKNR